MAEKKKREGAIRENPRKYGPIDSFAHVIETSRKRRNKEEKKTYHEKGGRDNVWENTFLKRCKAF